MRDPCAGGVGGETRGGRGVVLVSGAMATNTKRAYKLQEFVAHSSNVNCLKIGKKTSRVLVTGGEDHKVNLWVIGKPNPILNLLGHSSAIESVSFDSSEVLVAAGAASGTIKLWDLEEAKIVRTLTGHRSNCVSVDFHPFGEFFASGSLDTNLKIWDIRKKGCIHTYKGHTRGVNSIRFTPDGRWVVSGGEDNVVKLWDLTAGKLLHDFKLHEGQIQCIDFHPHEFLLATGSGDKTVKFWDLETFELIGSTEPEAAGVRSMIFHPDGRSLLCGLHESLKIFSWEPVRCHDAVDVGWSRLSDLNIHEGKLLGCSFNQSCVGVWVVDLSRVEPYAAANGSKPYAVANVPKSNGHSESKPVPSGSVPLPSENNPKNNFTKPSLVQNPENTLTPSLGRLSVSQSSDASKDTKAPTSTGGIPSTPQRVGIGSTIKTAVPSSAVVATSGTHRRNLSKVNSSLQNLSKADVVPAIVPRGNLRGEPGPDVRGDTGDSESIGISKTGRRLDSANESGKEAEVVPAVLSRTSSRAETTSESRKDPVVGRTSPFRAQSKFAHLRKFSNKDESDKNEVICQIFLPRSNGVSQTVASEEETREDIKIVTNEKREVGFSTDADQTNRYYNYGNRANKLRDNCYVEVSSRGRTRPDMSLASKKPPPHSYEGPTTSSSSMGFAPSPPYSAQGSSSATERTESMSNDDIISDLMEQHDSFRTTSQSRLMKLQVVHELWERNDIKGVITALEKMCDHNVSADVVSILTDKSDTVTLDICTCLLPVLNNLLESNTERHLATSLEMLLKLVRVFGSVIHSTVSAGPSSVGVDLQAEQRRERCNLCFIELEKVKHRLSSLTRRRGAIAKTAQELNLALQEFSS